MARMIDTIPDTEITTTGTGVRIYSIPEGMVAYLKNITLTNLAASAATIELWSGDPTSGTSYRIVTIVVAATSTEALAREIEGRKLIDDLYIVTDQQPIRVSGAVELE